MEYLDSLISMITNDASLTREIKLSISMVETAFNNRAPLTNKLDLNLRMKLVKCYNLSIVLYGAETCKLRKVDGKYLESYEK
jgi:hypothetical protein